MFGVFFNQNKTKSKTAANINSVRNAKTEHETIKNNKTILVYFGG